MLDNSLDSIHAVLAAIEQSLLPSASPARPTSASRQAARYLESNLAALQVPSHGWPIYYARLLRRP